MLPGDILASVKGYNNRKHVTEVLILLSEVLSRLGKKIPDNFRNVRAYVRTGKGRYIR